VKLVERDARVELEGELGHRLAHVSVVVNHLPHAETHAKHFVAMLRRARIHFVAAESGALQRVDELVDEQRDSVGELHFGRARNCSCCDLGFGPRDDFGALRLEELV
jgi:hypothetical protein